MTAKTTLEILSDYADTLENAVEVSERICKALLTLAESESFKTVSSRLSKLSEGTDPLSYEEIIEIAVKAKAGGLSEDLIKEILSGLGESRGAREIVFDALSKGIEMWAQVQAQRNAEAAVASPSAEDLYSGIYSAARTAEREAERGPIITPPPVEAHDDDENEDF
jgi:hypothetical protein